MSKIDPGQTINTIANLGVIAGIIFLAFELQQNNALLSAQARTERASVAIDSSNLNISNPQLLRARMHAENGETLTTEEEYMLVEFAWGVLLRWQYVFGEYREGLIEREDIPTEDWRSALTINPVFSRYWQENKAIAFRPDFVRFMEGEVLNER